jgi:hypothetical protein
VNAAYFFDDEAAAARIDAQLELLKALRDEDVRSLALRAGELSTSSRRALTGMVNQLRRLEGIDPQDQDKEKP